jgi:homoserine kinase type II
LIDAVYLLWFEKEMPEGDEDIELLIGVYSSEAEASAAIERVKNKPGFVDFQEGFHIYRSQLNQDSWTEGFITD